MMFARRFRFKRRHERGRCAANANLSYRLFPPEAHPRATPMKTIYAVATFVSLVVALQLSPAPRIAAIATASAAGSCPSFLNQEYRKLHSSDSVNLCALGAGKPMLIVNTASH